METIAFELTNIVRAFKVPALIGFDPRRRQYVYRETPTSIFYPVSLETGKRFDSLTQISPDIERELNQKFGRSDIRLFVQRDPPSIEVLKPVVAEVPLSKRVLSQLRPMTGAIGERYTISSNEILGIELVSPETSHVLVSGMTGSGKSSVLKAFLTSLCYSTSPEDLRLFGIDMKNRGLSFLSGFPHLESTVAVLETDAIETITRVFQLLRDRRINGGDSPRVVLAIDELAEFTTGDLAKALVSMLPTIARQGRELGIHLAVTIHRPTVSDFGGDFLQSFGAKVTGRLRNNRESTLILGVPDSGADRLGRAGQMIYYRGTNEPRRFQAYISYAAEGHVHLKWDDSLSRPMLPEFSRESVSSSEDQAREREVSTDLESLRGVIEEYVSFEGTRFVVRRGGWSRMAEALGTVTGGSTTTRCTNAILAYRKGIGNE